MLQRIATRLSKSRINIHRAYLDSVHDDANGWITLIGCVVQGPDGGHIDEDSELWAEVRHDLLRLKWYDQRTLALGYREPSLGLEKAEIILALLDLSYQTLVKINPYAFNPDRIEALLPRYLKTQIFKALLENNASEQGASMTAMDNATRNAGDLINKLTIQYNRSRQAAITTELVEIISGAEAL